MSARQRHRPSEPAPNNIVLVFQSMRFKSGRDTIAGVYRYAKRRGWQVQCFETIPRGRGLRNLLETWRPLGCLVAVSLLNGSPPPSFGRTPVVFLGRIAGRRLNVEHDSRETSRLAVRELALGKPAAWGFFGPKERPRWSQLRQRFYCEAVAEAGGLARPFPWAGIRPSTPAFRTALHAYLKGMPRPCALFVAADYLAGEVLDAAHHENLRLPHDLSIVSVDNDEQICENLTPTLSSVMPDFEGAGYAMCELLERRLSDPRLTSETLSYGPLQLVRRASSRPPTGSRHVNRTLEFIRTHVTDRIGVADVAAHLGYQRRSLERLFRAATGGTVLDAIHAIKLEAVKAIVRDRRNLLSGIAERVGFSSEAHLKKFFKSQTGMTMSAWRNAFSG